MQLAIFSQEELLHKIIMYLPIHSILKLAMVNSSVYQFIFYNNRWWLEIFLLQQLEFDQSEKKMQEELKKDPRLKILKKSFSDKVFAHIYSANSHHADEQLQHLKLEFKEYCKNRAYWDHWIAENEELIRDRIFHSDTSFITLEEVIYMKPHLTLHEKRMMELFDDTANLENDLFLLTARARPHPLLLYYSFERAREVEYIHNLTNLIPFEVQVAKNREMFWEDDALVENQNQKDVSSYFNRSQSVRAYHEPHLSFSESHFSNNSFVTPNHLRKYLSESQSDTNHQLRDVELIRLKYIFSNSQNYIYEMYVSDPKQNKLLVSSELRPKISLRFDKLLRDSETGEKISFLKEYTTFKKQMRDHYDKVLYYKDLNQHYFRYANSKCQLLSWSIGLFFVCLLALSAVFGFCFHLETYYDTHLYAPLTNSTTNASTPSSTISLPQHFFVINLLFFMLFIIIGFLLFFLEVYELVARIISKTVNHKIVRKCHEKIRQTIVSFLEFNKQSKYIYIFPSSAITMANIEVSKLHVEPNQVPSDQLKYRFTFFKSILFLTMAILFFAPFHRENMTSLTSFYIKASMWCVLIMVGILEVVQQILILAYLYLQSYKYFSQDEIYFLQTVLQNSFLEKILQKTLYYLTCKKKFRNPFALVLHPIVLYMVYIGGQLASTMLLLLSILFYILGPNDTNLVPSFPYFVILFPGFLSMLLEVFLFATFKLSSILFHLHTTIFAFDDELELKRPKRVSLFPPGTYWKKKFQQLSVCSMILGGTVVSLTFLLLVMRLDLSKGIGNRVSLRVIALPAAFLLTLGLLCSTAVILMALHFNNRKSTISYKQQFDEAIKL